MQQAMSMYAAGLTTKPKKVATVSPVIGDEIEDDDEPVERDMANKQQRPSSPFQVHQECVDEFPESMLQAKSSTRPGSSSSRLFGWGPSNQDAEAAMGRPQSSASSKKYTVLGQKKEWRKNRSQRRGGPAGAIRRVTGEDDQSEDREELGERASSYLSSTEDVPHIPALTTARSYTSQHSSRESQDSSRFSSGRRSENSSEHDVFVVTRQKSKYAAKLYLPGQNPLYLGRYRSEEAARAACENAFTTITTPRK